MKKAILISVLFAICTGCVPIFPYIPMSSHTIEVGAQQQADVLWVGDLRDGSLQRCYNSPQGPKCNPVKR